MAADQGNQSKRRSRVSRSLLLLPSFGSTCPHWIRYGTSERKCKASLAKATAFGGSSAPTWHSLSHDHGKSVFQYHEGPAIRRSKKSHWAIKISRRNTEGTRRH